jgi:hypothetical protein
VGAWTPRAHGAREGRVRGFLGGVLRCLADSESPKKKKIEKDQWPDSTCVLCVGSLRLRPRFRVFVPYDQGPWTSQVHGLLLLSGLLLRMLLSRWCSWKYFHQVHMGQWREPVMPALPAGSPCKVPTKSSANSPANSYAEVRVRLQDTQMQSRSAWWKQ